MANINMKDNYKKLKRKKKQKNKIINVVGS